MYGAMEFMHFIPQSLELGVDLFDILGPVFIGNQKCIRGVDDNKIINANNPHYSILTVNGAVIE